MVEYERGLGALLFAVAGDGSLSGVDGSVGDLDDIPVAVRLVRMTGEQFEDYRTTADAQYAADLVRSGTLSEVEARAKAAEEAARLLPDGLATEGHHFWTAYDGDLEVGMLWLQLTPTPTGLTAFGYDFLVHPQWRGRGYGRAILVAAEQACCDLGVAAVGLTVSGPNLSARHLYEELGFEVTAVRVVRQLW